MAHIEKYQSSALGNMLGHYERRAELEHGYERENIDPERTHLNYNLCERESPLGFVDERIGELDLKRAPRKDAVRMVDTVVTLPQTYTGDVREFMRATKETLDEIFGTENCVGAWVHMDEKTPHMHYASVPVTEDGRLSAKSLLNRTFMKRFHDRLESGVCDRLGIERAGLTLTDEEREQRAGKYVSLPEFKAAQDALRSTQEQVAQEQRRLESVRQRADAEAEAVADLDRAIEQAELQPAPQTVAESARTLWTARNDGAREEQLAGEVEGLRSRISELERANQRARDRVGELDRELPGLRERAARLGERLAAACKRVAGFLEGVRFIPDELSAATQAIASRLGIRVLDSMSYMVQQAKDASRALGTRTAWEDRNVSRGQSR